MSSTGADGPQGLGGFWSTAVDVGTSSSATRQAQSRPCGLTGRTWWGVWSQCGEREERREWKDTSPGPGVGMNRGAFG